MEIVRYIISVISIIRYIISIVQLEEGKRTKETTAGEQWSTDVYYYFLIVL